MNKLIALLFGLSTLCVHAQDTTCVMVTMDEALNFDYQTSEVIDREKAKGNTSIRVEANEVLCLHLYDSKKRFRDVTISYDDGNLSHEVFSSKDNVLFTPHGFGAMTVEVSDARRRK